MNSLQEVSTYPQSILAGAGDSGPWVHSPFFKNLLHSKALSVAERAYAEHYNKYGYVVIEDSIVDEMLAARIVSDMETLWPADSNRLQDAWRNSESIKQVATNELILSVLRTLYGREPVPFQTLNFRTGTQQRTHSDAIHFSSLPARFMCGVWTALEDVTLTQGPLHYYPGSQTLPEFDYYDLGINEEALYPDSPYVGDANWDNPRTVKKYNMYEELIEQIVLAYGFEKQRLTLKRGQSLIWSSNIFHGGEPILDTSSTRKSQVTHFHFDGVIPFTPMFSNAKLGHYHLPQLVNIRTGEPVRRTFNFADIELSPYYRYKNTPSYQIRFASSENVTADKILKPIDPIRKLLSSFVR